MIRTLAAGGSEESQDYLEEIKRLDKKGPRE